MTKLTVQTSFNTFLQLEAETLGRRVLAFIIDVAIMLLYLYMMVQLLTRFNINLDDFGADRDRIAWGWYSLISIPIIFYTLFSEVLSGGYTIGKYIAKIKVVKLDGFQPSFVDFFVRWIFRMVDIYLILILAIVGGELVFRILSIYMIGLPGIIAIARNRKGQRIGDMVAGTSVISAKQKQSMSITILKELKDDYKPVYSQVVALSDNDARIIKEAYESALKTRNMELIDKLVAKLEDVMKIKNEESPRRFIENVLKDFNYYTQNM